MHLEELRNLESRLLNPLPIPIIGRSLQKNAVRTLAENGSPDAVRMLAKAVACLIDKEIKEIALNALSNLKERKSINAFCEVWVDTRHRDLTNLLVKKGWVASAPVDVRVLTALKTNIERELNAIARGGKEIVPLLQALNDKDSEIASRASKCLLALTNRDAIDYICQKWAESRDKLLEQIICQRDYTARKPVEVKVLSELKVRGRICFANKEIVDPLLEAFNDKDSEIANRAKEFAFNLNSNGSDFGEGEIIGYICNEWAKTRDKVLEQIMCRGKYVVLFPTEMRILTGLKTGRLEVIEDLDLGGDIVEPLVRAFYDRDVEIANRAKEFTPREPSQRALFYFLTEQWEKYESLDYEHTLLQKVYELGDEKLRKQIADKARKAGRVEWIQIVAVERKTRLLEEMTDAEWKTSLAVLSGSKKWEEMWQLAQKAPAVWSKELLQKLKQAAWLPQAEQERVGFERLKQLSEKCLEKIESMGRLMSFQTTLLCYSLDPYDREVSFINEKILVSYSIGHSYSKEIKLWLMPDLKLLTSLGCSQAAQEVRLSHVAISPNGKLLASLSYGEYGRVGTKEIIELWKIPNGKEEIRNASSWGLCQSTLTTTEDTGRHNEIVFSPDDMILASCSKNGKISLWQMPDGQPLATFTGHDENIKTIVFSPDGRILASCSDDKTIRLWQVPDGEPLTTLTGHDENIETIVFSPDGRILASCSRDKTIRLWQVPNGQPLATLTDPDLDYTGFRNIVFRPDGEILASSGCSVNGQNEKISLWQIPDGQLIATLSDRGGYMYGSNEISFSPDGEILASVFRGKVDLWSSDLPRLLNHPIEQLNQENREFIENALQDDKVTQAEKHWLEFMQALMNWHKRFAIEVEDATQLISTGEFDIEIEG